DARQTPVLLGGKDRGREIELVVVKDQYQPTAYEAPAFDAPKELAEAWERAARLSSQVPSPAAYAPHLWRQYNDLLLRYEQLVRAGDQRKAPDVKRALGNLEEDLNRAQKLDLTSAANTLAMPDALGLKAPLSDADAARNAAELWNAKSEEVDK